MSRPLLGAHVSTAGGLKNAIANAERIGAECIQIFGSSPRQWRAPLPAQQVADEYLAALKDSNVKAVYLHAPYLINLASPDSELHQKSIQNLVDNLKIADALHADGVIFHLGSAGKSDRITAFKQQVKGLKAALSQTKGGKAKIVLENSSGGGGKFGATIEDIAAVINSVKSNRLGVCYDTAHGFEAGLIDEYSPKKIKDLLDTFDTLIGIDKLLALHVNDSKTAFGSNHDRHENLGKGHIGLKAFQNLAKEKRLSNTAWLLEVPGFDGMGPDKKNMDIMKSLF